MRIRLIVFFLPVLLLFSCDEFLLKKTVTVISIHGNISFHPGIPQLSGVVHYKIKNSQENNLSEVYLVCHPQVEMDSVSFNNKKSTVEVGEGMGERVYRVKIPTLKPGQDGDLSISFKIQGQFDQNRFQLSKDGLFFDVKQIWIPVPFADHFEFPYTMEVSCPSDYYSIMGAKKQEEFVIEQVRKTLWKSEINNALLTGSLHILPTVHYKEKNIHYYSSVETNLERIMSYSQFSHDWMKKHLPLLPFSEFHIIRAMYPYKDMKEVIDGEYMANTILLNPDVCDFPAYSSEKIVKNSPIPFIPNTSELKLLELIAHEYAHSYISTLLRFEDDYYLNMEALTEFLAIQVMYERDPSYLQRMCEKNRILLINLSLNKKSRSVLGRYLYMVNTLESAFWKNHMWTATYINLLIDKYRFSEVQWSQLKTTAHDINRMIEKDTNRLLINTEIMKHWNNFKLYNFSLSSSDVLDTNYTLPKWKRIRKKKKIKIRSHFPYPTDLDLVVLTPTNTYTNHLTLGQNGTTNVLLGNDTLSTFIDSRFAWLETHLADNEINYKDRSWQDLVNEINRFYKGAYHNTRLLSIEKPSDSLKIREDDASWNDLYTDREESQKLSPQVFFQFDKAYYNRKEFYIEAYKWINNKAYSYVIFRGTIKKNKKIIDSVLDPSH